MGDEFYKRSTNGVLLRYLKRKEAYLVMAQVHEGVCGSHKYGPIMKWLIYIHGYYWSTITTDCYQYAKGCEAYQLPGPIQRVPADELHLIVMMWPFRGWTMDLIGKWKLLVSRFPWLLVRRELNSF